MRSLRLQKLYLCSDLERKAKAVSFDPRTTVIVGENDTGKSSLIKSIYSAFGADAYKIHPNWLKAKANILVDFTLNGTPYRILRSGSIFSLFDGRNELLWSETGISTGVAQKMAELLDFRLLLQNRSGELVVPPPAYSFLPYYVDQDIGWLKTWSSFAGLAQFESAKQDATYFHAGLRPNEYYVAKAAKLTAERAKDALRIDRRAVDRAAQRLQAKRRSLKFDLQPAEFGQRLEVLLARCQSLQGDQEVVQRALVELHSQRAVILEQVQIARHALAELDDDFGFLRDISEPEVVCPTCGTSHDNDFANKFGLIGDADLCRGFLLEAQQDLSRLELRIREQRGHFDTFGDQIGEINRLLDEERGDVKLRDLLEGESERLVDEAIASELSSLDDQIGAQDTLVDEAMETMKSYDDKKYQKKIKDHYLKKMAEFIAELRVPGLPESSYKRIDCSISETGSDLPRALLAYYYAILHTMSEFSRKTAAPIIIDSPVQQDQDADNAARIIDFTLRRRLPDAQLILGTVSLHGVKYDGHVIETPSAYSLLNSAEYESVNAEFSPLFQRLLQS